MRFIRTFPILLAVAACGDGAAIEGSLLDPDDARQVWVEGISDIVTIDSLGFQLEDVRGDTIDLMFGDDGEPAGRMRLLDLPPGARLALHGGWFEDEIAFPTSVDLEGAETVTVNGLRMGDSRRLGSEVSLRGTVLAISGDGDHAVVRPTDEGIQDLRVIVGSAVVSSVDGEPVRASRLSYGDTVEVRGRVEAGYVMATELTVARSVAAGLAARDAEVERERRIEMEAASRDDDDRDGDDRDDDDRDDDARDRGRGGPPIRDGWPGRGRGRGRN